MKIVVSGKGGSGKSTVSTVLAKGLFEEGGKVLVVDNDESNSGLHSLLGLDYPKEFMKEFGGRDEVFDNLEEWDQNFEVSDIPSEYLAGDGNLRLLSVGKIKDFGDGCACPMNYLSGEFLKKLQLDDDEFLIVDMDAGVEHFGREVEEGADIVIVVVDPTEESVRLSSKISKMGEEIDKPVFFVLNKMDEESESLIREKIQEERIIAVIPRNEDFFKASLKGESLEYDFAPVRNAVSTVLDLKN